MQYYLELTVGAILVNNFVLSRFLGICPFLGVSRRLDTALGMSGAVVFVMTLASFCTASITQHLLRPVIFGVQYDLEFLQLILFILSIAALVQLVEIALQKLSPALYRALGIYLPLITTNCAVLGVALLLVEGRMGFLKATLFAFASSVGYSLVMIIFAGLRERLVLVDVPRLFAGPPIAFIAAGMLAMAFMGFSGIAAH